MNCQASSCVVLLDLWLLQPVYRFIDKLTIFSRCLLRRLLVKSGHSVMLACQTSEQGVGNQDRTRNSWKSGIDTR